MRGFYEMTNLSPIAIVQEPAPEVGQGGSTHIVNYVKEIKNLQLLGDDQECRRQIRDLIFCAGMEIKGEMLASFVGSFQLHFALAESFVVFEPWLEFKAAKIVVDICNFSQDNKDRALNLAEDLAALFGGYVDGGESSVTQGPF